MRMRGRIVAVFAAFLPSVLGGCAATLDYDGALAAIPYELQPSGRVIIEVLIEGRGPFRFALDTAATSSFVFARPIEALGLELRIDGERVVNVYGAVASGQFPLVEVARLEVGDEVWENVAFVALAKTTAATRLLDGVLGADFLRRYAVSLSGSERIVRLFSPDSIGEGTYAGWTAVRLQPRFIGESREPLHFLEIEIAGRRLPALLDLGAGVNVLNPPAAIALALSPRGVERDGEFADALGTEPVLAQFSSQQIHTGRVPWRNETFLIADMPIFSTLSHAERPLAILGSGLFNQRDLVIDFTRNRLLVESTMIERSAAVEAE